MLGAPSCALASSRGREAMGRRTVPCGGESTCEKTGMGAMGSGEDTPDAQPQNAVPTACHTLPPPCTTSTMPRSALCRVAAGVGGVGGGRWCGPNGVVRPHSTPGVLHLSSSSIFLRPSRGSARSSGTSECAGPPARARSASQCRRLGGRVRARVVRRWVSPRPAPRGTRRAAGTASQHCAGRPRWRRVRARP